MIVTLEHQACHLILQLGRICGRFDRIDVDMIWDSPFGFRLVGESGRAMSKAERMEAERAIMRTGAMQLTPGGRGSQELQFDEVDDESDKQLMLSMSQGLNEEV